MPTEEELLKQRMMEQKMAEHAAFQQQAGQQAAAQKMLEAQIKGALQKILEPAARERLANLKLTKPQIAQQLEIYLVQLYQAGQIQAKITDDQVIQILQKLGASREWKILSRHCTCHC